VYPNAKEAAVQGYIVENTAEVLNDFGKKGSLQKEKFVAKHAVLATIVAPDTAEKKLQRATAYVLKTRRRNVNLGIKRRIAAFRENGAWLAGRRRRRDAVLAEVAAQVREFWARRTRVLPNQKDVRRHRLGPKQYKEHPNLR
jgi:hypothetical protein